MTVKSSFDCVEHMFNEGLYDSVIYLAALLLTICERCTDFMTNLQRFQLTVYYAESLFAVGQYKKAEQIYMKALHFRRHYFPPAGARAVGGGSAKGQLAKRLQAFPEVEISYKLFRCLKEQKKFREAIGVLESIPTKSRSAKTNAALASLYQQLGNTKKASEAYREVLKECPYALDALEEVLGFGASLDELKATYSVDKALSKFNYMDWFPTWLEAHSALAEKEYVKAVRHFRELDTSSNVSNNVHILCALAKAYYYAGENGRAISVFQRAHSLDQFNLEGLGLLAMVLYEEGRQKELESLATRLMAQFDLQAEDGRSLPGPQPWIAMGYLCLATEKHSKALYFAHKACAISSKSNEESLVLKGLILLKCDKLVEATMHFREAITLAPNRFEIHQGLVKSYLVRKQTQTALTMAAISVKQLNSCPRSLALYASVLAKVPETQDKAMKLLERVVATAPYLLSAIYALVEIYDKRNLYEKAIELLRKQVGEHTNSTLHKLLGDFLMKVKKGTEALDRYRYALSLDPNNTELRRGMSELEDELLRLGPLNEGENVEDIAAVVSEATSALANAMDSTDSPACILTSVPAPPAPTVTSCTTTGVFLGVARSYRFGSSANSTTVGGTSGLGPSSSATRQGGVSSFLSSSTAASLVPSPRGSSAFSVPSPSSVLNSSVSTTATTTSSHPSSSLISVYTSTLSSLGSVSVGTGIGIGGNGVAGTRANLPQSSTPVTIPDSPASPDSSTNSNDDFGLGVSSSFVHSSHGISLYSSERGAMDGLSSSVGTTISDPQSTSSARARGVTGSFGDGDNSVGLHPGGLQPLGVRRYPPAPPQNRWQVPPPLFSSTEAGSSLSPAEADHTGSTSVSVTVPVSSIPQMVAQVSPLLDDIEAVPPDSPEWDSPEFTPPLSWPGGGLSAASTVEVVMATSSPSGVNHLDRVSTTGATKKVEPSSSSSSCSFTTTVAVTSSSTISYSGPWTRAIKEEALDEVLNDSCKRITSGGITADGMPIVVDTAPIQQQQSEVELVDLDKQGEGGQEVSSGLDSGVIQLRGNESRGTEVSISDATAPVPAGESNVTPASALIGGFIGATTPMISNSGQASKSGLDANGHKDTYLSSTFKKTSKNLKSDGCVGAIGEGPTGELRGSSYLLRAPRKTSRASRLASSSHAVTTIDGTSPPATTHSVPSFDCTSEDTPSSYNINNFESGKACPATAANQKHDCEAINTAEGLRSPCEPVSKSPRSEGATSSGGSTCEPTATNNINLNPPDTNKDPSIAVSNNDIFMAPVALSFSDQGPDDSLNEGDSMGSMDLMAPSSLATDGGECSGGGDKESGTEGRAEEAKLEMGDGDVIMEEVDE